MTWSAARSRSTPAHVPDFVIVRSNGEPLYTLVNPVDDSLMKITHVLRGEDLLPSTPRQIVLYQALNAARHRQRPDADLRPPADRARARAIAGCPSGTRDPASPSTGAAATCREALLNYLALLGWAIADDRDIFTLDEMVEAFDILRVNANPARFDAKKCEAINAAAHPAAEHRGARPSGWCPFFVAAGLVSDPPLPDERRCWPRRRRWSRSGSRRCRRRWTCSAFLFTADDKLDHRPGRGARRGRGAGAGRRRATALGQVEPFDHAEIEAALRTALIDGSRAEAEGSPSGRSGPR